MRDAPATPPSLGAVGAIAHTGLDAVTIRNLRAWTLIGVHPHEREMRQEVRIDAWLGTDITAAAAKDDLDLSIDYSAVARAFREHAGSASHQLIETLAEELATIALERFGALMVRIAIEKPGAVPGADAVGVVIERPRSPVRPPGHSNGSAR